MEIFTVIEMVDIELKSITTFNSREKATEHFDRLCQENGTGQIITDRDEFRWNPQEMEMFSGDEVYSVEMYRTVVS